MLLSVFHEFGHFASVYYDPTPSLFQNGYVDVSEIQSQGMQMLLMTFSDDMFGYAGRAMEAEAVSDLLDSIIAGAMMDEFETAVYAEPDMTLEDLKPSVLESGQRLQHLVFLTLTGTRAMTGMRFLIFSTARCTTPAIVRRLSRR